MKSLSCREMGVDCPFRAEGETGEEVKAKLLKHAGHFSVSGSKRRSILQKPFPKFFRRGKG